MGVSSSLYFKKKIILKTVPTFSNCTKKKENINEGGVLMCYFCTQVFSSLPVTSSRLGCGSCVMFDLWMTH